MGVPSAGSVPVSTATISPPSVRVLIALSVVERALPGPFHQLVDVGLAGFD
ncbi:hypothetical protein [Actinoplanes sp. L3-i22]|uniref:hypothetical protein n=1 Tax=Actinoplanes sp. L3-i22 TaxID=2836373 RepID=UPI001C865AE7|nr:hypothetical protein [Actinoplanes sp. L3-i22]